MTQITNITTTSLLILVLVIMLRKSPRDVMAKMMDCGHEVSEFELHSRYYGHFRTNNIEIKYELNITTALLPQRRLWHKITHDG